MCQLKKVFFSLIPEKVLSFLYYFLDFVDALRRILRNFSRGCSHILRSLLIIITSMQNALLPKEEELLFAV